MANTRRMRSMSKAPYLFENLEATSFAGSMQEQKLCLDVWKANLLLGVERFQAGTVRTNSKALVPSESMKNLPAH
jgi:hypothetical protein